MFKRFIIILLIPMLLSACHTYQREDVNNSKVDPDLITNQSARFFSGAGVQSCMIATGIVGAGCFLFTGNIFACSLIATSMCGASMAGNYYVDLKRVKSLNKEMRLDVYIYDIQKNTEQVKSIAESTRKILMKNAATLLAFNQNHPALNKAEASKKLSQIDSNIHYLSAELNSMKAQEKSWLALITEETNHMDVSKLIEHASLLSHEIKSFEEDLKKITIQRKAVNFK